jgi:hypothetical protein
MSPALVPTAGPQGGRKLCLATRATGTRALPLGHTPKFMIQTGDPLGDGTGGMGIWDSEFEAEFSDDLKHDRYAWHSSLS